MDDLPDPKLNSLNRRWALFTLAFAVLLFFSACQTITGPWPPPSTSSTLQGQVILENQDENSNALVYIDSLNRGTGTDSSGFYSFQFTEKDSIYTGMFTVYYFLEDYALDSARIALSKGRVVLDSLDVNESGNLPLKKMKQLVQIDGSTDKYQYQVGDTLKFTAKFTNLSETTIYIIFVDPFQDLGPVEFYRNWDSDSFPLTPFFDSSIYTLHIPLLAGETFEGNVVSPVPTGRLIDNKFVPINPGYYVVFTFFNLTGRPNPVPQALKNFIHDHWFDLHRGPSPRLDLFPNKYNLPKIQIME